MGMKKPYPFPEGLEVQNIFWLQQKTQGIGRGTGVRHTGDSAAGSERGVQGKEQRRAFEGRGGIEDPTWSSRNSTA